MHANINKYKVENYPALPGQNLISTSNCRVKPIPAGWVEISSQQTRIFNHDLHEKVQFTLGKKLFYVYIILTVIN